MVWPSTTWARASPCCSCPIPHGWTRVSIAEDTLIRLLAGLDRRVITFDPPGAYRSTRPARVDMPEMLACTGEALEARGVHGPVDVAGHGMGGLCALAFALGRPRRVRFGGQTNPAAPRHGLTTAGRPPHRPGWRPSA